MSISSSIATTWYNTWTSYGRDFDNMNQERIIKNFDGKSFSDFKNSLAELLVEKISLISDKIKEYKNDKEQLKKILKNGNEQASDTANKTIIEVKKIVGLI